MVRVFATISMLCAGASARRNEETTGFVQIKEMKADLSQMSYLEDVKTSLKKMALNRASVPDEAFAAIDAITAKLADILPPLTTEKNSDSQDQDTVIGLFSTANETYSNTMRDVNMESASLSYWSLQDAARTKYENCRATESTEWSDKDTCDGQQGDLQNTFDGKVTDVELAQTAAEATTCDPSDDEIYAFTTAENVAKVITYHDAIDALILAKSNLATKTGECDGHTNDYNNQHDQCDDDQNDLEDAACNWARAYHNAGVTYGSSYSSASNQYDNSTIRWNDNSANRKAQCEIVAKITCYVAALKDNNAQDALESAIQDCDTEGNEDEPFAEDFDCAQYVLAIQDKPDQITLQTTPVTHCNADFNYGTPAANTERGPQQLCCTLGD